MTHTMTKHLVLSSTQVRTEQKRKTREEVICAFLHNQLAEATWVCLCLNYSIVCEFISDDLPFSFL